MQISILQLEKESKASHEILQMSSQLIAHVNYRDSK